MNFDTQNFLVLAFHLTDSTGGAVGELLEALAWYNWDNTLMLPHFCPFETIYCLWRDLRALHYCAKCSAET
jgi:hypothetical protein